MLWGFMKDVRFVKFGLESYFLYVCTYTTQTHFFSICFKWLHHCQVSATNAKPITVEAPEVGMPGSMEDILDSYSPPKKTLEFQ